jgi:hypothetical protein
MPKLSVAPPFYPIIYVRGYAMAQAEIDNGLFDRHIPGEHLFRDTVTVSAKQRNGIWDIRYNFMNDSWGERTSKKIMQDEGDTISSLSSRRKGSRAGCGL